MKSFLEKKTVRLVFCQGETNFAIFPPLQFNFFVQIQKCICLNFYWLSGSEKQTNSSCPNILEFFCLNLEIYLLKFLLVVSFWETNFAIFFISFSSECISQCLCWTDFMVVFVLFSHCFFVKCVLIETGYKKITTEHWCLEIDDVIKQHKKQGNFSR